MRTSHARVASLLGLVGLGALVALSFAPVASAAVDVNRVVLDFADISSGTLATEILYTNDDALNVRGNLDADHNGIITEAELEAYRQMITSNPSDPIARVLLDGARPLDGTRATDVQFRDFGEDASSRDTLVVTVYYPLAWPAPAAESRLITLDSGERVVMAVHMEAPAGYAFTESAGMQGGSGIRDGGQTLSGLCRFSEPFSARLGPAPAGATTIEGAASPTEGDGSGDPGGTVPPGTEGTDGVEAEPGVAATSGGESVGSARSAGGSPSAGAAPDARTPGPGATWTLGAVAIAVIGVASRSRLRV